MTALAGLWSFGGDGAGAEADCLRMLRAQHIYGQEDGHRSEGGAALGRRIFRTLPEDRYDRGPSIGGDGRILVADVRLDNRGELAGALGLDPRHLADSALLLRALERWGDEAVGRLVGDFAFACWEPERRRLLLVRDFAGQRPLHYHEGGDFFAFASMPKGLHALDRIPRRPDLAAVAQSLAGAQDMSRSFFAGIRALPPGESLVVEDGRSRRSVHWMPDLSPLRFRRDEDYAEGLIERLDCAVAARLRGAGASVGAHLSGGLDSAAVASGAARLLEPSGGRLAAFTAVPRRGYDGPAPSGRFIDEASLAAETAALYPNIDHVPVDSRGTGPLGRLDRAFFLSERPAGNPCNLGWVDAIKDEAKRRGLSLLLIGELGNMSLSYSGSGLLFQLLSTGRAVRLARELRALRRSGRRWRSIAASTLGPLVPAFAWRALGRGGLAGRHSLVSAHWLPTGSRSPGAGAGGYRRAWVEAISRHDPGSGRKATLAGWGLDTRDPTADRRLVEYCLRVPLDRFQVDGRSRALARRALAGRLPAALLEETRRGYQAPDWHESLLEQKSRLLELIDRELRSSEAAGLLDLDAMARLLEEMPSAGWETAETLRTYRIGLLRAFAAGDFVRRAGD